uniref:Nudix hydrolase domain-containing protein n=1 Tax=Arundo donax TaxID=35708 RepID=A0A0A9CVD9_ARUDO
MSNYFPEWQTMIGTLTFRTNNCKYQRVCFIFVGTLECTQCHLSLTHLCWMVQDENRTSEEREKMGQTFTVHYFTYEKENQKYIIWGLTARILIHAASVVYERPPDFPEQRVQFNLAKYHKEYSSVPLGSVPARH